MWLGHLSPIQSSHRLVTISGYKPASTECLETQQPRRKILYTHVEEDHMGIQLDVCVFVNACFKLC